MKKCKKIILLALVVILSMSMNVYAESAVADVTITQSSTTAKVGDTVTITLTANSSTEIEGFDAVMQWDQTKLEFVNAAQVTAATVVSDFNAEGDAYQLSMLANSQTTNELQIPELKFKVLDNVVENEELKITLSNVQVSPEEVEDKEIIIKVSSGITPPSGDGEEPGDSAKVTEINITNPPTKTTYKVGEKFDPTGIKVVAVYDDGTKKEITDFTYSPDGELKETDTIVFIKYYSGGTYFAESQSITVESATQEDSSTQENPKDEQKPSLPYAGIEDNIPMLIIATIIISIGLYIKCKKYKDVI